MVNYISNFCLSLLAVLVLFGCEKRGIPAPVEYGAESGGPSSDNINGYVIYHRVVPGDTLIGISSQYMVTVDQLVKYNKLRSYQIKSGQVLAIPQSGGVSEDLEKVKIISSVPIIKNRGNDDEFSSDQQHILGNKNPSPITAKDKNAKTAGIGKNKASARDLENKLDAQLASVKAGGDPSVSSPVKGAKSGAKDLDNVTPKIEGGGLSLTMPLNGKILSKFHAPLGNGRNDGMNIAAKLGTPIKTAGPGVVLFASNQLKAYGNLILIKHNDSIMTVYGHLLKIKVKKGMKVSKRMVIGTVGKSGNVSSPQLHFEVRQNKQPVDPYKIIKH